MTILMSTAEAAIYLGVHPATIRDRVHAGKLHPSKVEHRSNHVAFWFTKQRLDAYDPTPRTPQRRDTTAAAIRGAYRGADMPLDYTVRGLDRWLKAREKRIAEQGGRTLTW